MPLEESLRCALEMADALTQAHRQGLIHRDLKPANIMLTKAGAKVLKFRLAGSVCRDLQSDTLTKGMTSEGMIIGTYPYMSPEQLQGHEVDARSDIFSFGAVLYEMASGQRAFAGKSTASIIAAVLEHQPPPLSEPHRDVPPSLEWIIRTCLAKDPEDRWQSAHDLMLHLGRLRDVQSDAASVTRPDRSVADGPE